MLHIFGDEDANELEGRSTPGSFVSVESDETPTCSICFLELDSDTVTLKECGHTFHSDCIIKWFRSDRKSCPLCRTLPDVVMKMPDVMQRGKMLLKNADEGTTSDPYVLAQAMAFNVSEHREATIRNELAELADVYTRITKPKKDAILREYRELRHAFKKKTVPLLRQLDTLDETDRRNRKAKKHELAAARRRKREILRELGLHPLS